MRRVEGDEDGEGNLLSAVIYRSCRSGPRSDWERFTRRVEGVEDVSKEDTSRRSKNSKVEGRRARRSKPSKPSKRSKTPWA